MTSPGRHSLHARRAILTAQALAPDAMQRHPLCANGASSGFAPSGPSTLPAVWAAAVHIKGVTGLAVFEAETTSIWVAEAPDEPAAGFAFLRLALERAAPRTVYASSKASDEFVAAIAEGLAAARDPPNRRHALSTEGFKTLPLSRARSKGGRRIGRRPRRQGRRA